MIYPPKEVGQLIKKHRLLKNMNQEMLCDGICSISYLSKIESGLVTANAEIMGHLFSKLDIDFITDESFLREGATIIQSFFRAYFFDSMPECNHLFETLLKDETYYLFSPLAIDYQLTKLYYLLSHPTPQLYDLYELMQGMCDTLSPKQHYYLTHFEGILHLSHTHDIPRAIEKLRTANTLHLSSKGLTSLAQAYFDASSYPLCIDTAAQAFTRALDEGNIACSLTACMLQGDAHQRMHAMHFMFKYYHKALNICEALGDLIHKQLIYHNIGSALLLLDAHDKALTYLLQALALAQLNHRTSFTLYYELATVYFNLGNYAESEAYLHLAESTLTPDQTHPSLTPMVLILHLRLKDPYTLTHPDYLTALEAICLHNTPLVSYTLYLFFKRLLLTYYKANRRYKDALAISESLHMDTLYFPDTGFQDFT